MTYNPASAAGTIFPIVGMGIGIGILAHTARNVTRMTDDMYSPRRRTRRRDELPLARPRLMTGRSLRPKLTYRQPRSYRWKY